jgi:hypothetical protein
MFDLTLVDHLRLTFGHVIFRHKAHAQIAHTRARWSRWLKGAEALLVAAVAFTAIETAMSGVRGYAIACAVFAGATLGTVLVDLTFDFGQSARIHAWCATELWQMRERYRALLSDLADSTIDLDTARRRRDTLMDELHGIYQNAPPADAQAYRAAAQALGPANDAILTDEEIDLFLPKSLRKAAKAGKPEAA